MSEIVADQGSPSGDTVQEAPSTNGNQGSDQTSEYSLASPFMEKIPAEHRELLEPYVKQWDAGVSRRFQDLHGKFKPFEDLGADPETLSQAYQIYQLLDSDPKQIYDLLREDFENDTTDAQEQDLDADPAETPGIPKEWESRFTKQQEILEALVDHVLGDQKAATETKEDQEFDQYLDLIKQEAGETSDEFENFILAQLLANDGDGNAAIQAWSQFKQGILNTAAKPAPPTLSGGGSVPSESQSVKDLSKKDTVSFVANLLSQVNKE